MYLGSKIKRVGDVDKYFLGIDETLTSVAGINILRETSTNIKYSGIFIEVSWIFIRPKKGRNKNQRVQHRKFYHCITDAVQQ